MAHDPVNNRVNPFLGPAFFGLGLIFMTLLLIGCEIRPKPFIHQVEYQSTAACKEEPEGCSWERLEQEAEFSALVNCLLAGANVLAIQENDNSVHGTLRLVVTPLSPRYGYDRVGDADQRTVCSRESSSCSVASRHDREVTWARCGTRQLNDGELRGGETFLHADNLPHTGVYTGTLARASDDFSVPAGFDGPDHIYQFTLTRRTRIEAAVAANRAMWSGVVGLVQSAWQPALSLLTSDGAPVQRGYVLRAGVTALLPSELEPGAYYLVVDSSMQEWTRGDGLYRLYLGYNKAFMGAEIRHHPLSSVNQPSTAQVDQN